jgi:tRNA A58 N-methylase Trm61
MAIIKRQKHTGMNVEKKELLHTVSGNVNYCSLYGKQYGGSSKN